jgi:hypothetical protein
MTVVVNPGSVASVVRFGIAGLERESSCTINLMDGQTVLDSITSTTGSATRTVTFSGLSQQTIYGVDVSCSTASAQRTYFQTSAQSTGDRAVSISFGTITGILPTAARVTVEYDDNEALSSPATTQNTNCGTGCTVSLSLPAGLYYWRHKWQTAADAVLATGAVQPLAIP